MDPKAAYLKWRDEGKDRQAARDYNEWIAHGGYAHRVQLHPATDLWMAGGKYGSIVKLGTKYVTIVLDVTGRRVRVAPEHLIDIA